jgi:hypothetical protein
VLQFEQGTGTVSQIYLGRRHTSPRACLPVLQNSKHMDKAGKGGGLDKGEEGTELCLKTFFFAN